MRTNKRPSAIMQRSCSDSLPTASHLDMVFGSDRSFFGHEPLRSTEIHSVSMSFLLSPESPHGVVSRRYAAEARSPATKLDLIGRTFVEPAGAWWIGASPLLLSGGQGRCGPRGRPRSQRSKIRVQRWQTRRSRSHSVCEPRTGRRMKRPCRPHAAWRTRGAVLCRGPWQCQRRLRPLQA